MLMDKPAKRWVDRKTAMAYCANAGATKFNELIQQEKIIAVKDGVKVIIDLNSVDEYLESLPPASKKTTPKPGKR
jgi:hypothetical protein